MVVVGYLYTEFTTQAWVDYTILVGSEGERDEKSENEGKIIEQIKTLTKKKGYEKIAVNNFYNHNHDLSRNFSISSASQPKVYEYSLDWIRR